MEVLVGLTRADIVQQITKSGGCGFGIGATSNLD